MNRHIENSIRGLLTIVFTVLLVLLGYIVWSHYSELNTPEEAAIVEDIPEATPVPLPDKMSEDMNLDRERPENYTEMRLAVAGDIVVHIGLNNEAQTDESYDYTPIMEDARGYLEDADFALATIETTFLGGPDYTGYPTFKSPDALAANLKALGIDMVNTASNHCMDTSFDGLKRTLDVLEEAGLKHAGTYRDAAARAENSGITLVEVNDIKIAFLAYTYSTNGIPITGSEHSVNLLYNDYMTDLIDIDYDGMAADMEAARELDADIIAVITHWGVEYQQTPSTDQYAIADFLFAEGADLILGGHPHSPQPLEVREVVDNEGNRKLGFIAYSLGNFVSCQEDQYTNLTAILNIGLVKDLDTGETYVSEIEYAPMFMVNSQKYDLEGGYRYRLLDLHKAIDDYEAGERWDEINRALYESMLQGLDDLHGILGEQFDKYEPAEAEDNVPEE